MKAAGMWGVGAWGLLVSGAAILAYASVLPFREAVVASPVLPRLSASSPVRYPAESLSQFVVSRDLFRAGRRPAPARYDPIRSSQPVAANVPPKPVLALVGIVAGTEPIALVEGFPGIEGVRVVRVGDLISGLRVKRIDRAAVRVVGMDTVWVLKVREPWK